jgi:hypothetical protein
MLNGTSDNGSAISAYVTSKFYSFGAEHLKKEMKALDIVVNGQTGINNLTCDIYKDGSSTATNSTSVSQTSDNNPYSPDPMTTVIGMSNYKKAQVKFTQNTLDKQFEIYKFGFINSLADINY